MLELCNAWLNNHAGLFALLALVAAIWIPRSIYRKQKRDRRNDMQDELEAMNEHPNWGMTSDARAAYTRKRTLEKGINRK